MWVPVLDALLYLPSDLLAWMVPPQHFEQMDLRRPQLQTSISTMAIGILKGQILIKLNRLMVNNMLDSSGLENTFEA